MGNEKNLVLIGMPGCGKTTVGSKLALQINREFIDLDICIEKNENMKISEIFSKGEKYFRDIETIITKKASAKRNAVISTGGGIIKRDINMSMLKKNGIIIFIDRPVQRIIEDIDAENRPLLKNNAKNVNQLFEERYEIYNKYCDFKVNNTDLNSTVQNILNIVGGVRND